MRQVSLNPIKFPEIFGAWTPLSAHKRPKRPNQRRQLSLTVYTSARSELGRRPFKMGMTGPMNFPTQTLARHQNIFPLGKTSAVRTNPGSARWADLKCPRDGCVDHPSSKPSRPNVDLSRLQVYLRIYRFNAADCLRLIQTQVKHPLNPERKSLLTVQCLLTLEQLTNHLKVVDRPIYG
jgi:hypothetical protein